IAWIDAGVEPGGLLARVNGYLPAGENPCLECAWSDEDYQALESSYPCDSGAAQPTASNAPSGLGALAASLQVLEAQKFLVGRIDQVVINRQVLIDASQHKHYVTAFRRNPNCRFDHAVWRIEALGAGCREKSL